MKEKINIAIVDDQQLFRQGIISLLSEFNDFNVVFEASNGQELLSELKESNKPIHVVLLDIEMPVMDGIETTIKLKSKYPKLKIIILTMHDEEEMMVHLIEKGAHGFLPKNEDIERVADAIYSVHANGYFFNEKVSQAVVKGLVQNKKIFPSFGESDLSDKEIEVMKLICHELTSREISDKLGYSSSTIENFRTSILKKIGARNTAGIVMYALKRGLVT